jgi:hypothetical protein
LDEIIDKRYKVKSVGDTLEIDYIKTKKDLFDIITQGLLGLLLICFPSYILYKAAHISITTNSILVLLFLIIIISFGLFKFIASIEILSLPTNSFIIIDKRARQINVKLSFYRTKRIAIDNIATVQLAGSSETVTGYWRGSTVKRQYYFHQLMFLLKNGKTIKIHRFITDKINVPILIKKDKQEISHISKYISNLIAKESGLKYNWLGTKKI